MRVTSFSLIKEEIKNQSQPVSFSFSPLKCQCFCFLLPSYWKIVLTAMYEQHNRGDVPFGESF